MTDRIIARRYADGFLSYAKETIGLEKAVSEMKDVKMVISGNPDFEKFLDNLEITNTEKCAVIDKVFADLSEDMRHFLKLLLEKGRIDKIILIADYVRTTYGHGEKVGAVLNTTFPLELDLVQAIKEKMEKKFKKKLNLYLSLNPDLIGGIQVVIGNTVIDGSVKKCLEDLREKLMAVKVI